MAHSGPLWGFGCVRHRRLDHECLETCGGDEEQHAETVAKVAPDLFGAGSACTCCRSLARGSGRGQRECRRCQRRADARRQGASLPTATGGVLTLMIVASPNASSVWVRVVGEVSGAVFEQEVPADLPAANQFHSPPLFMNNGATAAAVAFDCSGAYLETDC